MRLPTKDEVLAFSRHAGTSAASVVGTLAALKIISGGDASSLQSSIDQISHGVAEIVTGVSALGAAAMGIFAALSANPLWQLIKGSRAVAANPSIVQQGNISVADQASVAKAAIEMPKVESIVAAPEVAAAVPSPLVQSSDQVKIVQVAK